MLGREDLEGMAPTKKKKVVRKTEYEEDDDEGEEEVEIEHPSGGLPRRRQPPTHITHKTSSIE